MKKKIKTMAILLTAVVVLAAPAWAASVKGSVAFSGTAPAAKTVNMAADPTCAAQHKTAMPDEDVIVNANNTLKNVFVYVKSGLEGKTFPTPAASVSFDQNGCHYVPHVLGVMVGQTFEIINSDSTLHNVHSLAKESKQFNLGMPIKGMKIKKKFEKPEVMAKLKCDVHPWMHAYVGVLSHPFYAVSGEDGSFEIKDLPAGKYTLEAWHETLGTKTQEMTVVDGADAPPVQFSFGS